MSLGGSGLDPRLIFLENIMKGQGRQGMEPNMNFGPGNPLLYGGTDPAAMGGQTVQQMQMPQQMPSQYMPDIQQQQMPGGGDQDMMDMMDMFFGG